ncbi:MAG: phosphoribosylamine--glycine ligase, partial [Elusimicrobia bacterium]|nr:phosphoribosylamine--glycine ligase [Elusimicrobiota bacterium]
MRKANVLILGSGGREHALAWALSRSPGLKKLYAAPGSAGMAALAKPVHIGPLDFAPLESFCHDHCIDLVVVGPEAPLAGGVADALEERGIRVFGPRAAAARLEASKAFAKGFMARHAIPTARHQAFSSFEGARSALPSFGASVVVKADGLAAGKGVRICESRQEAEEALSEFMVKKIHSSAGNAVVLEERLQGREATMMAFCDGRSYRLLPPSQDHKRLLDSDRGPNTGGMGVFAPTPAMTPDLLARIRLEVFDRALSGLQADRLDYRGILYAGLMLTKDGPKVLEFNVRFGDPETQAVLPLLETDLLDLLLATVHGKLSRTDLRWRKASSVCVVLASEGYPEKPKIGRLIEGLDAPMPEGIVFHAGTRKESGGWRTAGGRVLGVTAVAPSLEEAR